MNKPEPMTPSEMRDVAKNADCIILWNDYSYSMPAFARAVEAEVTWRWEQMLAKQEPVPELGDGVMYCDTCKSVQESVDHSDPLNRDVWCKGTARYIQGPFYTTPQTVQEPAAWGFLFKGHITDAKVLPKGQVDKEYTEPLYTKPQPAQGPVHQFRRPGCSDWYDGIPDQHDGGGPYEVRTLYASVQPSPKTA